MRDFCPFHKLLKFSQNNAKRYPFGSYFGSYFGSLFGSPFHSLTNNHIAYMSMGGSKIANGDVFLGEGGHWKVDMGRYGGGRGQKWPKIGDVVYGWPLTLFFLPDSTPK